MQDPIYMCFTKGPRGPVTVGQKVKWGGMHGDKYIGTIRAMARDAHGHATITVETMDGEIRSMHPSEAIAVR